MASLTLHDLEKRVQERARASADVSYTRKLIDRGVSHCAKKLGEEAVETVMAGAGESAERLKEEAADLLYHLLVLLESREVAVADVLAVLEARMGTSGLKEKAERGKR
jgi:phosphoribosyl-ATP pyrophosphohydrolase